MNRRISREQRIPADADSNTNNKIGKEIYLKKINADTNKMMMEERLNINDGADTNINVIIERGRRRKMTWKNKITANSCYCRG